MSEIVCIDRSLFDELRTRETKALGRLVDNWLSGNAGKFSTLEWHRLWCDAENPGVPMGMPDRAGAAVLIELDNGRYVTDVVISRRVADQNTGGLLEVFEFADHAPAFISKWAYLD